MSIHDRDYMKRRRNDDDSDPRSSEAESKIAGWIAAFFEKHPRCGVWVAVVLLLLILGALIVGRLSQQ